LVVVLLLAALTASTADAQRRTHRRAIVGSPARRTAHTSATTSTSIKLLVGAQLTYPFTPDLGFYPTFDYYFVSGGSLWALNFDLKYRPPTRYGAWYVGGGLNWSHASAGGVSGSNTNFNLLTGLEGRRGRTRPYIEGKFILGNGSSFQIVGGVSWH